MSKNPPADHVIELMQALHQKAAAWLLGFSPRTLRDQIAPRNADGSYNAAKLVEWLVRRKPAPKLPDDELEKLLTAASEVTLGNDEAYTAIVDLIDELQTQHGGGAVQAFGEIMVTLMRRYAVPVSREPATLPEQRIGIPHEDYVANKLQHAELRVATVCERCDRLRRGSQWIKSDPPSGFAVRSETCPQCAKR